jgi:hypothetical protein
MVRRLTGVTAPTLTLRLKKAPDGGSAISCTRADGTVTWQRQDAAKALFFVRHDLTHYAVETVLGHRRGFYGLLAEGWGFTDFGSPWPRGPIPADADPSELWVGFFDAEHAGRGTGDGSGQGQLTAADFNAQAAAFYAQHRFPNPPTITDEQLGRVRELLADLLARWQALPPGEVLELPFDPRPASRSRDAVSTRRSGRRGSGR